MLIKLKTGDIINLYNVVNIIPDKEGQMGVKYILVNNQTFSENFDTEVEVDARIEELMSYNIGLTVPQYNQAVETAQEIKEIKE